MRPMRHRRTEAPPQHPSTQQLPVTLHLLRPPSPPSLFLHSVSRVYECLSSKYVVFRFKFFPSSHLLPVKRITSSRNLSPSDSCMNHILLGLNLNRVEKSSRSRSRIINSFLNLNVTSYDEDNIDDGE